ncbi:MAG TPA: hypothetical protein DCR37_05555 [Glaciecola sp.]|nr:hypothetical protein [Glaciecola sp.]
MPAPSIANDLYAPNTAMTKYKSNKLFAQHRIPRYDCEKYIVSGNNYENSRVEIFVAVKA